MRSSIFVVLLFLYLLSINPVLSKGPIANGSSSKLTSQDLVTANGSCRVGRQNGHIYCVLTGTNVDIQLVPNSWSDDEESKRWNAWLVNCDNALFSAWVKSGVIAGQETVNLKLTSVGKVEIKGRYLVASRDVTPEPAEYQRKFESAIQQTIEQVLKAAPPMPTTKNPFKELNVSLTFMRGDPFVPDYGARDFGFLATVVPSSDKLTVYGGNTDGREPGIQIIDDDGSIQIMERAQFLRRCDEVGAH